MTSPTPTKYALGSVLNHVLLHQTVIGIEAKRQLDMAGDYPDVVVGLHRRRAATSPASPSRSSPTS